MGYLVWSNRESLPGNLAKPKLYKEQSVGALWNGERGAKKDTRYAVETHQPCYTIEVHLSAREAPYMGGGAVIPLPNDDFQKKRTENETR